MVLNPDEFRSKNRLNLASKGANKCTDHQVAIDETHASMHRRGETGHAELMAEGLSDPLLALSDKTVRGPCIPEARTKGDTEPLKNLFVLAFQTRWCRGGKGEHNILYDLLVVLYARYAAVLVDLV